MSRRTSKGHIERSTGAHMLRKPFTARNGYGSVSVVGLGVFKARGQIGDGLCQRPSCLAVADLFGVWIYNGHLVVIGICPPCAQEHLRVDEGREAQEESDRMKALRKAYRRAHRRREKADAAQQAAGPAQVQSPDPSG